MREGGKKEKKRAEGVTMAAGGQNAVETQNEGGEQEYRVLTNCLYSSPEQLHFQSTQRQPSLSLSIIAQPVDQDYLPA